MKIREGRLVNARFTDRTCTMIRAEFKDYSKPEGENLSIQMHTYNPQNKIVQQILAEHSEEDEPQEPDWELVDRLKRIAESDETEEIPHPELPHAPNLPHISAEDSEE